MLMPKGADGHSRLGDCGGEGERFMVGEAGFEPATSASRTLRAKPAALLPDADTLYRERGN